MADRDHDVDTLPLLEDVRDEVLEARQSLGLSQDEVAERAGVDQKLVSRLERGVRHPRYDAVRKVVNRLRRELAGAMVPPDAPVAELSSGSVVALSPSMPLQDVWKVLTENHFSSAPIKEGWHYADVVVKGRVRDLLIEGPGDPETPLGDVRERAVTGEDVRVVGHDTPIEDVLAELPEGWSLFVVRWGDRPDGVVTSYDAHRVDWSGG